MKKILALMLSVAIFLVSGHSFADAGNNVSRKYQTYKDIPGVAPEEIRAITELLEDKPSLVYGVSVTTEAFLREDGSVGGFSALFADRMSELFGFDFTVRPFTWNELVGGIASGDIDFTGEFSATPNRHELYFMTDPIAQRTVKVFTHQQGADLRDTSRQRPVRCAFLDGSAIYPEVRSSWDVAFEPVFIDDELAVPDLLSSGEIDAFIGDGIFEASFDSFDFVEAQEYHPLIYSPVSLTTGNPELRPVIGVMQKFLENGGNNELIDLYQQGYRDYQKYRLLMQLTEEEKEYIRNHSDADTAISVACEINNYPMSFYNTNEKEFQGVSLDVLDQVSALTGLKYKPGNRHDAAWMEILQGLEDGTYSVITELLQTNPRKERFLWTADSYYTDHYAMVSRADYPEVDINRIPLQKVGLLEDTAYADVFFEWFPNSENTVMFGSKDDAIPALEKGEIDLLMVSQNFVLHLVNYLEKPSFKANIVFQYSAGSFFGLNKGEAVLCSILDKAIRYIDTGKIADSWQRKVFDYEGKLLRDMLPYGLSFTAVLLLAFIGVFVLLIKNRRINKNLDKTVAMRTSELETQAVALERQLAQQRLMATLSQNFIAEGDIGGQITESLRLIGGFLNVSRILLLKYQDQSLNYSHEWRNPAQNVQSKVGTALRIADSEMSLVAAYSQRAIPYFCLDDTDGQAFLRRYQLDDIQNFILLPIYSGDAFWGVLEFDQCESHSAWAPSDINLGEMVAGILSGVISRHEMEQELVLLSSIVENSPQFTASVRGGGSFAYCNPAVVEFSGYSREELDRGGLRMLLSDENYRRLIGDILPIIAKNKKHNYELPFIIKGGEERIMSVSAFSLKSDPGVICSIATDITDLVMMQRERERQASELALQTAMLSTMFTSLPDSVFCKDLNLCYTRCNKNFERFLDRPERDILGKNVEQVFGTAPERAQALREIEQQVIREKKAVTIEESMSSPSGETRLFETIRTPLIQDGEPIGLIGIARDITRRKMAEETLKLTLDNLDACVYVTEIETGKILFVNKKMTEEHDGMDCVGKICWEVLQTGHTQRCDFCPVPKLLENGGRDYVWESYNSAKGKYYRNSDSIIQWHDGRRVHMQHMIDITDIKATQSALNKRLQQQSLMTHISQSFLFDTDAGIDALTANALRMVGEFMEIAQILCYKMEQDGTTLICQNEWIAPELGFGTRIGGIMRVTGLMASVVERMSNDREFRMTSNDPAAKAAMAPYRVNFENYITTPLFVKDKLYGVLDFSKKGDGGQWSESDIDLALLISNLLSGFFERRSMESELVTAKELAEQGSRSKSDFLSRMSHEIRTPLNAIIGMVGIAMTTAQSEKTINCLVKADNASKHLLGIINDILDMSKIEADKFELDRREFNFEKMLMNVTNVTNFRAEEKKQNFIVNLNGNVPESIVGDDLRLAQVIANLLTNAVKFTPEHGTVVLSADKIEDDGGEVTLRIEVEDNGIGISEEQQKRLFTSFEQADGGIARKFGGTGLGLAISKRIVELMGGRIWIESELGKGSKFIFTIKAGKGDDKARTELSEKIGIDKTRVLAVDDGPETRQYFARVMESLGLRCDVAASGAEALDMIKACGDEPYGIFFVDWQMPETNAIELAQGIRQAAPKGDVVFMIPAAEWNVIEKEALAAGVRSFISKPLFPSTLINAINDCVETEPRRPSADADRPDAQNHSDFSGHTILIAEDIEINREIMSTILEDTGVRIDYAENGTAAVAAFSANPDKYSLILMDIHMPEMDGYEATRRIRALDLPRAKHIPIIAMTANVFREDVEHCLEAGMNDHIGKPIDHNDLFTKLGRYLSKD